MNKKIWIVLIVIVLILISVLLCIKFWPTEKVDIIVPNGDIESDEPVSKYVMEESNERYSARILESENKDFITLYVETNIVESGDKVLISYNNEKLLLNTANPFLENVEIKRNNNISNFELNIETLKNYGIIFIKKNPKSIVVKEDITIK